MAGGISRATYAIAGGVLFTLLVVIGFRTGDENRSLQR